MLDEEESEVLELFKISLGLTKEVVDGRLSCVFCKKRLKGYQSKP